jgi:Protein of unknown function (DUF3710)
VSRFRRRGRDDDEASPVADDGLDDVGSDDTDEEAATGGVADDHGARSNGPWDVSEVEPTAAAERVDLGGVWLPGRPGLEVRIEADETTGAIIAVTMLLGGSALQVQPFAAPRSEGIWADVRREIKAGITQQGGTADEVDGPFGPELRTKVPVPATGGGTVAQTARFIGVDGPRWFLRGVLTGDAAAQPEAGDDLIELFRDVVVVRGTDAMAPREPIPLRMPSEARAAQGPADTDDDSDEDDPLTPFERGPEITEIH